MANWFDKISKTLADDKLSRRQAVQRVAGTVAGVAIASLIPGEAFAASEKACTPGTCSTSFSNCGKNVNCYCFQKLNGKGGCGCNTYCSSAKVCAKQSDCGKGYICITNTGCGCTSGVCVQKCNKTCHLSSDRAGRTAA